MSNVIKPEVLLATAEALRSGKYAQTTGTLHDGVGYCCLGVMSCVIAEKDDHFGIDFGRWDWTNQMWHNRALGNTLGSDLPHQIAGQVWREVKEQQEQSRYMRLNDENRENFDTIADIMEQEARDA